MENSFKPIEQSFASVNANCTPLAKALVLPVVAYLAIASLTIVYDANTTFTWILRAAILIPITLIAITTHRIILLGPESVPTWGINRFGWREIKFMLAQYMVIIFLVPVMVLFFVPFVGPILGMIAGAYMLGRMSLVFPSIALQRKFDFKDSWDATKNYKLMMFVVVAVFPFVLGMIEFMLERIQGIALVLQAISLFTTVYVVAALSIAYQIIMEPESDR